MEIVICQNRWFHPRMVVPLEDRSLCECNYFHSISPSFLFKDHYWLIYDLFVSWNYYSDRIIQHHRQQTQFTSTQSVIFGMIFAFGYEMLKKFNLIYEHSKYLFSFGTTVFSLILSLAGIGVSAFYLSSTKFSSFMQIFLFSSKFLSFSEIFFPLFYLLLLPCFLFFFIWCLSWPFFGIPVSTLFC